MRDGDPAVCPRVLGPLRVMRACPITLQTLRTHHQPPALSAVLRIGDQVMSVDNVVVLGQAPAQVEQALKGKVGSEVTIGFQRNGVHKKAAITRTATGVQWAADGL